jgi:thymidylate synthase ThyX
MPDSAITSATPAKPSETAAKSAPQSAAKSSESDTEVYAIHGAEPEVLAYAMAKYSRSALTMRESLVEISSQRAEQFLNTFYFQYGHRSIADLAHIPFAIEKLSLLAAIALVDETRWDGQERSTRYQDFRRSGWHTPHLHTPVRTTYTHAVEALFDAYDALSLGMFDALKTAIPQPDAMKPEAYARTLKARAFDAARYLLPLATNTSLGQIVNARTLETQVSRLLSSDFAEIRELGTKLRSAASEPAWNVLRDKLEEMAGEGVVNAVATAEILNDLMPPVRTAPTLVKYAEPNAYQMTTRRELTQAVDELMAGPNGDPAEIYPAPIVDLLDDDEDLEVELATSLLYPCCHYSYRQLRGAVAADGMTSCCAPSTPATASASTSSWTSVPSATCIATAVACSSSRSSATAMATTSRSVQASRRSPKLASTAPTRQRWTRPTPPIARFATAANPRPNRARSTCSRSAPAAAPCSRWTSRRRCTSRSCAAGSRGTSAIGWSRGRCTRPSRHGTRRWLGCSGLRM